MDKPCAVQRKTLSANTVLKFLLNGSFRQFPTRPLSFRVVMYCLLLSHCHTTNSAPTPLNKEPVTLFMMSTPCPGCGLFFVRIQTHLSRKPCCREALYSLAQRQFVGSQTSTISTHQDHMGDNSTNTLTADENCKRPPLEIIIPTNRQNDLFVKSPSVSLAYCSDVAKAPQSPVKYVSKSKRAIEDLSRAIEMWDGKETATEDDIAFIEKYCKQY